MSSREVNNHVTLILFYDCHLFFIFCRIFFRNNALSVFGGRGGKVLFSFILPYSSYFIWTFLKKLVLQLLFLIKHLLLNLFKSIKIISGNLLAKVDGAQMM